ncbi:amino acid ABC transporter substrate-binding protein [Aliiroseovarius sp. S1123]|uniref:amino acid ABC transporter substrate-binding protein n=1 Tax=Aliiroseovarius sp. S1123 TaxID=2926404 RepID=UPI001FF10E26|nr:amino acid ABC transporter substrate-binding protein [Aliiroseovarius sp. S1123]MCK0171174.1 amino acid ABC transporter substrate-binding protein [Aliiroseovarius sp. S1123]
MKTYKTIGTAAALALTAGFANAGTLDDVRANGKVVCGVHFGLAGFAAPDDEGNFQGLDVDVCRAVAAAVFGDPDAVDYTSVTAKTRFTALQGGEIDMLSRNTTWTYSRDAALGLDFTGVTYYDGQGFMVRKDLGVSSALELNDATVCTSTGTTTELNLKDYFDANNMNYKIVAFEKEAEVVAAYEAGRCDVYTTDASALAAARVQLANADEHMILPEIISKEPLGPVVRQGDDQWGDVVRWSLWVMDTGEELGITSENVDQIRAETTSPEIRRILGVDGDLGEPLGLSNDFAYQILKNVGNYGESFERHVGPNTPLGLGRGLNDTWKNGGLRYAAPIR